MGNTILIKHGAGAPTSEQLQPYELGFDKTDKKLYIGVEDGEPELLRPDSVAKADYADKARYADEAQKASTDGNGKIIAETYIQDLKIEEEKIIVTKNGEEIKIGDIDSPSKNPYTIITKPRRSKENSAEGIKALEIICKNLQPNTNYIIKLYTLQRERGRSYREWRHPANIEYSPENGYTEEQQALLENSGLYSGYRNIAGEPFDEAHLDSLHPQVPNWMPNNGVLKTEWHFTSDEKGSDYKLSLDLNTWILDLLKLNNFLLDAPEYEGAQVWTLMGVGNSYYNSRSRLFQFRIESQDGKKLGNAKNTVRIGSAIFLVRNGQLSSAESGVSYLSIS